jgi:cell division protein FtsZ
MDGHELQRRGDDMDPTGADQVPMPSGRDPVNRSDQGDAPEGLRGQAEGETWAGTLCVLGIGGAGVRILESVRSLCDPSLRLVAVNTDHESLAGSTVEWRRAIGGSVTRGLGAGGDPVQGRFAAERDERALRALVEGCRLVVLVTGLGGGTGTGATPVIARMAREAGALVLVVAGLPFEFEGKRRMEQAMEALPLVKAAADAVLYVPNERLLHEAPPDLPIREVFDRSNQLLAEGVVGLVRLLMSPGLIQLEFSHLERMLRGRHAESFFASVHASGPDRVRLAIDQLMASPFLLGGQALMDAEGILVSMSAGRDLRLDEVQSLMGHVSLQNAEASVILGTALDDSLGDRLMLTVVTTRGGSNDLASAGPAVPEPAADDSAGALQEGRSSLAPSSAGRMGVPTEAAPGSGDVPARLVRSRLVPPAPDLTPEQKQDLLNQGRGTLRRKRPVQTVFKFDVISRGRFEKTQATILRGEDLDLPTFMRRGVSLN